MNSCLEALCHRSAEQLSPGCLLCESRLVKVASGLGMQGTLQVSVGLFRSQDYILHPGIETYEGDQACKSKVPP